MRATSVVRAVVIEHNLDVIKTADWLIDLGPEGGGKVLAAGIPEDMAQNPASHTGEFLKHVLERTPSLDRKAG